MTVTENQKRLVVVGATGMVGGEALRYALDHPAVGAATAIGRKPTASRTQN
jgi:N-acetyl-gamma-glutamylphosphate reductase